MRDTSDAGALEYWGVGAWNTAHHNCFSDMDPGIPEGAWMNFLFQDDFANYLNFSSNILFELHGAVCANKRDWSSFLCVQLSYDEKSIDFFYPDRHRTKNVIGC